MHVVPSRVYFTVFAALMALLAVTVGAAYLDLGAFNLLVAMAIAVAGLNARVGVVVELGLPPRARGAALASLERTGVAALA